VSKSKLLLWFQKHYFHLEFKPNYAFIKYILYVYFMGHKRKRKKKKLEKQLKLGFIIAWTFSVSVVCVNPSQGSLHS